MGLIEVVGDVSVEFLHEERRALCPSSLMANGILDGNLIQHSTIFQGDCDCITNRSFRGFVVIHAICLLFLAVDFGPELVDTRVGSGGIRTANMSEEEGRARLDNVLGLAREFAEDERIRDHIVNVMAMHLS